MRLIIAIGAIFSIQATAQSPARTVWEEMTAKREKLSSLHQEFEFSRSNSAAGGVEPIKRKFVVDMCGRKWRETTVTASGDEIRIFDGTDLLVADEGDEFVRMKLRGRDENPLPSPYGYTDLDWRKAVIKERRPCGLAGKDHVCVALLGPLKTTQTTSRGRSFQILKGSAGILLDTETGMLISLRVDEVDGSPGWIHKAETTFLAKNLSYGGPADASLFRLPPNVTTEVKNFTRWSAALIRKRLTGKIAPELNVNDMQGNLIDLSQSKGKIVLLDFWATWCPPCRKDGPALENLYRKYRDHDLMVVGISLGEYRRTVEQFLGQFPHTFPIVLTSENDLPRAYYPRVIPTYIVIDRDGTVATAIEGDQGFSELRALLEKAGLEVK